MPTDTNYHYSDGGGAVTYYRMTHEFNYIAGHNAFQGELGTARSILDSLHPNDSIPHLFNGRDDFLLVHLGWARLSTASSVVAFAALRGTRLTDELVLYAKHSHGVVSDNDARVRNTWAATSVLFSYIQTELSAAFLNKALQHCNLRIFVGIYSNDSAPHKYGCDERSITQSENEEGEASPRATSQFPIADGTPQGVASSSHSRHRAGGDDANLVVRGGSRSRSRRARSHNSNAYVRRGL